MPYDTLVSDEAGQDLFVSLSPELPDSVLAKAQLSYYAAHRRAPPQLP